MIRYRNPLSSLHLIVLYMSTWVAVALELSESSTQTPCDISLLIPFRDDRSVEGSNIGRTVISQADNFNDGLTLLATALLAIRDFNNRTSHVAPNSLDSLTKRECEVSFPQPKLTDSGYAVERVQAQEAAWVPANNECSIIIGPKNSQAAQAVGGVLNGTKKTMAISYGADELAAKSGLYPNLLLGTVAWEHTMRSLFQYLNAIGKEDVGILSSAHNGGDVSYSNSVPMWRELSGETGIEIKAWSHLDYRSSALFEDGLRTLQEGHSVKTIIVTLDRDDGIEQLAEVADKLGMLKDEYLWIFMGSFLSPRYVSSFRVPASSATAKLFAHSELFQVLDGFSPFSTTRNSLSSESEWKLQSVELVDEIASVFNQTAGFESTNIEIDFLEEQLLNSVPAEGASLIYDAVFAAGISICNREQNASLRASLLDVSFPGVSGHFEFEADGHGLHYRGLQFASYSIQQRVESRTAFVSFEADLLHQTNQGGWKIQLESDKDPSLSRTVRIAGFALAGIALFCSISSCLFIFCFRKDCIVSIGQPEFLYIICFGSFLLALPIILKSFDEGSGWSIEMLNASCTCQAWLKYLGVLSVDMALFSKLYRIEKVTQIRRGSRVHVKDVIKPFFVFIVLALLALIVWTILDPPEWRREDGSVGICYSSRYFGVGMDVALIFPISITLWWSRKTRDLPEDISDSERVYQTLVAQFVLLMFEILFAFITASIDDNDFAYAATATLSFSLSISSIAYLIVPKMYYVWRKKLTGEMPPSLQRGTVQVSGIQVPIGTQGMSYNSRYSLSQRASLFARSNDGQERSPRPLERAPTSHTDKETSETENSIPTKSKLASDVWINENRSSHASSDRSSHDQNSNPKPLSA